MFGPSGKKESDPYDLIEGEDKNNHYFQKSDFVTKSPPRITSILFA
jgi:hypothetical protein